jgi:simple sugar transport system permease protein
VSITLPLIEATLRDATPLLLATLGGVLSERSGVVNLGLEGYLLAGAFGTAAGTLLTGSAAAGVGFGVASAVAVAFVHGLICTRTRADHVVAGVALNLLVSAATVAALVSFYQQKGASPGYPDAVGEAVTAARTAVPLLGEHSPLTWLGLALVPAIVVWLSRTRGGLRLRAVGENPDCAESLGVSALRVRLTAVLCAGAVTGLGGAYLALDAGRFAKEMASGRGYLALACVVIGKWRPGWAAAAAIGFAALTAASNRLQLTFDIPPQLPQFAPYMITLVVLSGLVGSARPPAALGRPLT